MKILIGYSKNLHRLKASIVERYIVEEAIEFCSKYIEKAKPVGLPESWHDERVGVRVQEDYMLSLQV